MKKAIFAFLVFTNLFILPKCSTDLPRLTLYRDRIWKVVEKFDHQCLELDELVENRTSYAGYRAIQIAEDLSNQISYTQEELKGITPPDMLRDDNDMLLAAGETLALASVATETFAASPNDKAKYDQTLLYLRTYRNQRDISVNRIARAMEAAGLVAHPPEPPIPSPSKVPPADAHIFLE